MNILKLVKIKKSTIFLLIIASPALLFIANNSLINWIPVHINLTLDQHEYHKNFRIFINETIYCMEVKIERPLLKTIAASKFPDEAYLFKFFDFDWILYEDNLLISSGNNKSVKLKSIGWSYDVVSFEFNCFLVKPLKKYELKVNLSNSPSEVLTAKLNSELLIVINSGEEKGRMIYLGISLLWLLMLSPFFIFKLYKAIKSLNLKKR